MRILALLSKIKELRAEATQHAGVTSAGREEAEAELLMVSVEQVADGASRALSGGL
jgi:hypothetical protein